MKVQLVLACWLGMASAAAGQEVAKAELPDMPEAKVTIEAAPEIGIKMEPTAPVERPKVTKSNLFLTLANGAVTFADTHYTESHRGFVEDDPLAKPIVKHEGLAYGVAAAEVAGLSWLHCKMDGSRRLHRISWLPQVAAIAAHGVALGQSVANWVKWYPFLGAVRPPTSPKHDARMPFPAICRRF